MHNKGNKKNLVNFLAFILPIDKKKMPKKTFTFPEA